MIDDLQDEEAGVRYWAAISLAALGPLANPAETFLVRALDDQSAAVRIEVAGALAHMDKLDLALPVLTRELESPSLDAVLHAARTVELLGEPARVTVPAMQNARQRSAGDGDLNMFIRFATDAFLASLNH
jgi:HEAT repeat protein